MAANTNEPKLQDELDFASPSFNALKALYSKHLQPPVANARIFNNINEYAKSLKAGKIETKQAGEAELASRLKNIAENKLNKLRNRKRDPSKLEHLMKVKSQTDGILEKVAMLEESKKKKGQRLNVLERMEVKHKEGPLSILYNCIEKKTKLKVWTRKLKGLRGVCVGYLIAFDKHMNLAMMDVDEMFAIEEEVVVDPKESLAESLRKIEKRKEKKRKWRRQKRERLRNVEERDSGKVFDINIETKQCPNGDMGTSESSTGMEIENSKVSISEEVDGNLDRESKENVIQSNLRNVFDNAGDKHTINVKAMDSSTANIALLGSTASIDTENNERNSFEFDSDGLRENLGCQPKEESSQNYLDSECFTMERESKECSTGLFQSTVDIDAKDSELQIKKREKLRECIMNQEADGKGLTMDIKKNECSTTTINPAFIIGVLESSVSIVDRNSGMNSLNNNDDSLNCQANYAESDFTNDFDDESLREENIGNQSLRMGVKETECSSTVSNVQLLESDESMEIDNSHTSTEDNLQSHDSIERKLDQQESDEDIRLNMKTDIDNEGKENAGSLSPDIQTKKVNENNSVGNQESQKPVGHIETESDVFDRDKDETLGQTWTDEDRTEDSCSGWEGGTAETRDGFRSDEEEEVVEEGSDGKDLSTNDEGNKDDSFGEETRSGELTIYGIMKEVERTEIELKEAGSLLNNDEGNKDDSYEEEITSNELTIYGIMKEVKRTESELKQAGSLLNNDKNSSTFPYQPYSILQGNVLAMEMDEGSQDSVMFDRTFDRGGASIGVQVVTLHHKITYGMDGTRGSMTQDCGRGSLVKAIGDNGGDVDEGGGGSGNAGGIDEDVGCGNSSNDGDVEVDCVMTKVSEMDDASCDGNDGDDISVDDAEYAEDTDKIDAGNDEAVSYDSDSDGTIATAREVVDRVTEKVDDKADVDNGVKVDEIDGSYADMRDGINEDGILGFVKDTSDHSHSHDGHDCTDESTSHDKNDDTGNENDDDISVVTRGKYTNTSAGSHGGGGCTDEGTSHDTVDGIGNENGDGISVVIHGKVTATSAGSHDGDGRTDEGTSQDKDDDTGNKNDYGTSVVTCGKDTVGGASNHDGDVSNDIENGCNEDDDSVEGIAKGTDNNSQEKSIDEGKLRSIVEDDGDNSKDEEHSVAEKKVADTEKILTDVFQSENMEIKENVEEKEEGELTSSSDDENLEECRDSAKDKEQNKAGFEKVLAPKCHGKISTIKLISTGTTTKKIQGNRVKEVGKRRNSISCSRESSEVKEKITDEKRGQKIEKQRRHSLVEKRIDYDGGSSKRAASKDKTEGRIISLSKDRKSEKDNVKKIKDRRSSSTSEPLRVTDRGDNTDGSSSRTVENKNNARSSKLSTSKGREHEKDNVKKIKNRRSSSTSEKRYVTDMRDNMDSSSSRTVVESKDNARSSKISSSKERERGKDSVKTMKVRRSSSTSEKRNVTDIGESTDGSSSRTVESKDNVRSNKLSASKEKEREKDNVKTIKERRSSSTSEKRNVTDIGESTDGSSSRTVESKDNAKSSKISTSKGREREKDNVKTNKERRSSSTSEKRNVTDIGESTDGRSSRTVESKDNAKSSKISTSKGREHEKDNIKTNKERRSSSTSEKRNVIENEGGKDSSLRKLGTKENAENRKSLRILGRENKSKGDNNKTIEKKRNSTTVKELESSSSSRDLRSKDSLRKSKSMTSSHDECSELKKVNKTANNSSLTKSEKDSSCGKLREQTENVEVSCDKTNSRDYRTRHKELGRRESRSSSESSTRNLSRNRDKESDNKHKTQIGKSRYKTLPVEKACERTTRQSSTGSESFSKRLSKSSKEVTNKSSKAQSKGVEPIKSVSKDSSDGKGVREKISFTEVRRSSRVSDKKKNIGDEEVSKNDSKKEISKTKGKTDAKRTTSEKESDLVKHEVCSLKSQEGSSVKRKQFSLKKGDGCKIEKTSEKKGSLEKDVKENVICKNEDFSLKSESKLTVKRKESCSSEKYDRYGTGQMAEKKGLIKGDSLKNDDNVFYKKGQSVSKNSDNECMGERKSARNAAKEKSFSKDEKPAEEHKMKSENDAKRTRRSNNNASRVSEGFRNNKISRTKSLENGKEKIEGTHNGSVKQKDGSSKTSESFKSNVAQKQGEGKEAVAKKKLTIEEYKRNKRLESKDSLKNEAGKTVTDKSKKSTQHETLKESEKIQRSRKSNSQKQVDKEKMSGKRKREANTEDRPQKVRKTTNMDTNEERVKIVKTKEVKLPGNVVTVRILKVERGKALVLKRRHVNQLFIRGDNIIMVAYENVATIENKL